MLESYLISVAMKSTILLAAGLFFLRCLGRQSAAVRHLVCLAALASAAAVPLLALWSPQWSYLISIPARSHGPAGSVNSPATGLANWPIVLAVVWALGAFVMTIRVAGGWFVLLRARRRSRHFTNGDVVEVRIADVSTPLTCGTRRPLILLPTGAIDWDDLRLRAVLLHESAHVLRRDCLAKYVAQASRALLWWNPLAWMIAARLNSEQELACDDVVLSAGVPADTYATVLLDVARECSNSIVLGCAMAGSSPLRQRLVPLFEWRKEAIRSWVIAAIAIALLRLLMTTVSWAVKIYKIGPGIVAPKV